MSKDTVDRLKSSRYPYEVSMNVSSELVLAPDVGSGFMFMRFSDTNVTVTSGEQEIGEISAVLGGGIRLQAKLIDGNSISYYISAVKLWEAFVEGLKVAGAYDQCLAKDAEGVSRRS